MEEKYEFLNYIYLFENWDCAKISLRKKVSNTESAKICVRQIFSFYSTKVYFSLKKTYMWKVSIVSFLV